MRWCDRYAGGSNATRVSGRTTTTWTRTISAGRTPPVVPMLWADGSVRMYSYGFTRRLDRRRHLAGPLRLQPLHRRRDQLTRPASARLRGLRSDNGALLPGSTSSPSRGSPSCGFLAVWPVCCFPCCCLVAARVAPRWLPVSGVVHSWIRSRWRMPTVSFTWSEPGPNNTTLEASGRTDEQGRYSLKMSQDQRTGAPSAQQDAASPRSSAAATLVNRVPKSYNQNTTLTFTVPPEGSTKRISTCQARAIDGPLAALPGGRSRQCPSAAGRLLPLLGVSAMRAHAADRWGVPGAGGRLAGGMPAIAVPAG